MRKDIIIYITPCDPNKNVKQYNKSILEVLEESRLEYKIDIPQNRLQGLIKVEIETDKEPPSYKDIARNLKYKLESKGIDIKRISNFLGKPLV